MINYNVQCRNVFDEAKLDWNFASCQPMASACSELASGQMNWSNEDDR